MLNIQDFVKFTSGETKPWEWGVVVGFRQPLFREQQVEVLINEGHNTVVKPISQVWLVTDKEYAIGHGLPWPEWMDN